MWEGLCAGKKSVAEFLVRQEGFKLLEVVSRESDETIDSYAVREARGYICFETFDALLDFATKNWEERWVMIDIRDESILHSLQRRPFFLLISVDAPMTLRWARRVKQYGYLAFPPDASKIALGVKSMEKIRQPSRISCFEMTLTFTITNEGWLAF